MKNTLYVFSAMNFIIYIANQVFFLKSSFFNILICIKYHSFTDIAEVTKHIHIGEAISCPLLSSSRYSFYCLASMSAEIYAILHGMSCPQIFELCEVHLFVDSSELTVVSGLCGNQ